MPPPTPSSAPSVPRVVSVDKFCHRQFPLSYASLAAPYGGAKLDLPAQAFESLVNEHLAEAGGEPSLEPGYAPFCKHVFLKNGSPGGARLTGARVSAVPVTPANEHLLRSGYEARTPKELPVLTRFFPPGAIPEEELPVAEFLDVILYSREQINKENKAMGDKPNPEAAPWGVVSIKTQLVDHELPMNPITAMRNALGEEHGGSGKPIDRREYQEAVDFWEKHAIVK